MRTLLLTVLVALLAPASALACPGDGDGDGTITAAAITAAASTPAASTPGPAGEVESASAKKGACPGCPGCPGQVAKANQGKDGKAGEVTIGQLVALRSHGGALAIVDANGPKTREKFGMIPGAIALTNYKTYDIAKELPADKGTALVFYCSSTRCGASHLAATRAQGAGFTKVLVLPEGIKGWTASGQKTTLNQS